MKRLNLNLDHTQKALLVIIPLLYFIAASYFRNLLGNLSLRSCDPEYIYFMSGLTVADGVLKVGHIDNPGTPLQLLVALVFKIVFLIRSTPTPFLEDVLLHPDLYIGVVSQTIAALTTILLMFTGWKVFKYTGVLCRVTSNLCLFASNLVRPGWSGCARIDDAISGNIDECTYY